MPSMMQRLHPRLEMPETLHDLGIEIEPLVGMLYERGHMGLDCFAIVQLCSYDFVYIPQMSPIDHRRVHKRLAVG